MKLLRAFYMSKEVAAGTVITAGHSLTQAPSIPREVPQDTIPPDPKPNTQTRQLSHLKEAAFLPLTLKGVLLWSRYLTFNKINPNPYKTQASSRARSDTPGSISQSSPLLPSKRKPGPVCTSSICPGAGWGR